MSTTELVEKARALLAAAAQGPWPVECWYGDEDTGGWAAVGPHHHGGEDDDNPDEAAQDAAMADAALIAFAVSNLPAVLDAFEHAQFAAEWWAADCAIGVEMLRDARLEVDALRAEVEKESALRAELTADVYRLRAEVERMKARTAGRCRDCNGFGTGALRGMHCATCHGSGAVIVEG